MNKAAYFNKMFNICLYFFIYSFSGWIIETIYMSIYHGHIVKRGFLIGPLCGVYGLGTLLVVYVLRYLKTHPILLFLCSCVLTSILELIVGLLLERLLNQRLWNYSGEIGSFLGYICLRNSVIWGILAILVVYFAHPIVIKLISLIPIKTKVILFYSLLTYISLDLTISIYTSFKGDNSLTWLSNVFMQKIEHLENATSKVVYYFRH